MTRHDRANCRSRIGRRRAAELPTPADPHVARLASRRRATGGGSVRYETGTVGRCTRPTLINFQSVYSRCGSAVVNRSFRRSTRRPSQNRCSHLVDGTLGEFPGAEPIIREAGEATSARRRQTHRPPRRTCRCSPRVRPANPKHPQKTLQQLDAEVATLDDAVGHRTGRLRGICDRQPPAHLRAAVQSVVATRHATTVLRRYRARSANDGDAGRAP